MQQPSYVLEVFEGPLDLLLHLIKKNKISIYDIPIAEISEQYISYLQVMKESDLEVTSEFVVMAAQLLYIKSAMLLPKPELLEDAEDPRAELVERLLEYSRYKAAGAFLEEREDIGRKTFFKQQDYVGEVTYGNVINDVTVYNLFEAVYELLQIKRDSEPEIIKKSFDSLVSREVVSVTSKISELRGILKSKGKCRFYEVFENLKTRPQIVAMFLGVLELMKSSEISVTRRRGEIFISGSGNNEQ